MTRIRRRPGIDDDIFDIALYLVDRSESTASRFVDAVQKTLKDLAPMPAIGSRKDFDDPALAKVRTLVDRRISESSHLLHRIR